MGLLAEETWVNATEGYGIGESGVYETFADTTGELYRACVREHGRCTGKVYIGSDDNVRHVGWVFVKRAQYDDDPSTFLRETWVTVHDAEPTRTTEHHYHAIA
jgi:hypothetical protein